MVVWEEQKRAGKQEGRVRDVAPEDQRGRVPRERGVGHRGQENLDRTCIPKKKKEKKRGKAPDDKRSIEHFHRGQGDNDAPAPPSRERHGYQGRWGAEAERRRKREKEEEFSG